MGESELLQEAARYVLELMDSGDKSPATALAIARLLEVILGN